MQGIKFLKYSKKVEVAVCNLSSGCILCAFVLSCALPRGSAVDRVRTDVPYLHFKELMLSAMFLGRAVYLLHLASEWRCWEQGMKLAALTGDGRSNATEEELHLGSSAI